MGGIYSEFEMLSTMLQVLFPQQDTLILLYRYTRLARSTNNGKLGGKLKSCYFTPLKSPNYSKELHEYS